MAATSALARPLPFRQKGQPFGRAGAHRRWMSLSSTASDADLVALARRGEPEAITLLVERYSPRLYRYLLRFLAQTPLAEDILQETWLRVVEQLESYDPGQPFVVWLFAVARHRAIDAWRQRARETRLLGNRAEPRANDEGEWLEPLAQVAAQTPSVLDHLAEADLERRVAEVFTYLPPYYREVLTLRFHEDLRLEEIARLLGVPLSTVKTRVQRGLLLLRQRVEGLGLKANE